MAREKKKRSGVDWDPEKAFDAGATLEELINAPPFREVSDEHGHSATAGSRIPFWLQRRFRKMVEMKGSPYDLISDVLRDALFIGGRVLSIRYSMSTEWDVETKMAAAVDATTLSRRIRGQVEELVRGLDDMVKDSDTSKAAEHLTDYVLAAIELDNDWHREKLFTLLNGNRTVKDLVKHCQPEIQKLLEQGGKR